MKQELTPLQEIRIIREQYALEHQYDMDNIFADIIERQCEHLNTPTITDAFDAKAKDVDQGVKE